MNTIETFHIIAGLSALPMVFSAGLRMRKAYSLFAISLFVICVLAAMAEWCFLLLCTSSISLPFMVDEVFGQIDMSLVNRYLVCCLTVFANVTLLAMTLFLRRGSMKRFVFILLCLFLSLLLALSVLCSLSTGRSLEECFFGACCGVMYVAGTLLGFTYKEICVLVNIYLEAGLCLLSGLWVTATCIRSYMTNKSGNRLILMIAGIVYGLVYVSAFAWVCLHYALPMDVAFDLCYHELQMLAKEYHTTYNNMNYVMFILLFLACMIGNMTMARLFDSKKNIKAD